MFFTNFEALIDQTEASAIGGSEGSRIQPGECHELSHPVPARARARQHRRLHRSGRRGPLRRVHRRRPVPRHQRVPRQHLRRTGGADRRLRALRVGRRADTLALLVRGGQLHRRRRRTPLGVPARSARLRSQRWDLRRAVPRPLLARRRGRRSRPEHLAPLTDLRRWSRRGDLHSVRRPVTAPLRA